MDIDREILEQINATEMTYKGHVLPLRKQYLEKKNLKKGGLRISNNANAFFVVKEIIIRKVPDQNNRIEVVLVMPEPSMIEVEVAQIATIIEDSQEAIRTSPE